MSAKTKPEGLDLLREPFPDNLISKLPKAGCRLDEWKNLPKGKCNTCGGWHATTKTIHLDFVGHAALTDRLLDADPLWSWEPLALDSNGLPALDGEGGLWIKLTVCNHTRLGYGNAEKKAYGEPGNRTKELIGDALRNAAMRFGAALTLWHKGDLHADHDDDPAPSRKPQTHRPDREDTPRDENPMDTSTVPFIGTAKNALAEIWNATTTAQVMKLAKEIGARDNWDKAELDEMREAVKERRAELEAKP